VVYDWGAHLSMDQFLAPFVFFSAGLFLLAVLLLFVIPQLYIGAVEGVVAPGGIGINCRSFEPLWGVIDSAMVLDFLAVALSGTVVAMLDPTLQYRIGKGTSMDMNSTLVGTWFMLSSITYVVASVPIGWLADRFHSKRWVLQLEIASGFAFLTVAFALLGPLKLPGMAPVSGLDNYVCVTLAVCLKGIGSAASVIPVYADLTAELAPAQALLPGVNVGCLAVANLTGSMPLMQHRRHCHCAPVGAPQDAAGHNCVTTTGDAAGHNLGALECSLCVWLGHWPCCRRGSVPDLRLRWFCEHRVLHLCSVHPGDDRCGSHIHPGGSLQGLYDLCRSPLPRPKGDVAAAHSPASPAV